MAYLLEARGANMHAYNDRPFGWLSVVEASLVTYILDNSVDFNAQNRDPSQRPPQNDDTAMIDILISRGAQ